MNPSRRLLLKHLVWRGAAIAPTDGMVSIPPDGAVAVTWRELDARSRRLARGLAAIGLTEGDPVATLAFNDHRHLDAYLAVPCLGAIIHPVNVRWRDDEIVPVL
ncbi:MAG: hypothetical protein RLZZ461_2052, partial [Planctomycetota bacterium]